MQVTIHYREMRQILTCLSKEQRQRFCGVLITELLERHREATRNLSERERSLLLEIPHQIERVDSIFWKKIARMLERLPSDEVEADSENTVVLLEMIENYLGVISKGDIESVVSCIEITTDNYLVGCAWEYPGFDQFDNPILDKFLEAQRVVVEMLTDESEFSINELMSAFLCVAFER